MKALPFDVLRRMNYRAGTLLIKVRAEARREDANARTEPDIGPEPAPMLALSRTEYELALAQGRDPWEESS